MDKMMTSSERTNQTLDKHVGDSTDSDNEEKEDGELEEGEVEEEFDENPQQKDEAKENNRENNNTNESTNEQNNTSDLNLGGQKFRRRDYPQHHHHLNQTRLSGPGGPQDKRNKHDLRRKRRHSGEDRDDRNRKQYKRGRFRGGPLPDLPEDAEDDEMIGLTWPPRGQNRGQRKQQSDIISNENSESIESTDQQTSLNLPNESKSEQSLNSDETLSPTNDINDDDNMNSDDKQDRGNRPRINRPNQQQQQQQQQIENRGRRYYDNNTNPNNNMNNRRNNDRDRSSWQDRPTSGNMGNNANTNNNPRFRSDTGGGSSTNHGPPLCKFFVENRCMKGNDCLFSHDFKPAKKMEVCKYYVQNKGYCQKNELCPYLHNEFPCKFFHTGTKDCTQGDRCKFSHDPIINEDIRFAFERFLNDSEEMNRQNRGNPNNNLHHTNNPSSVNFDVMNGPPLPPPLPMPGSLTDPSNFPMIPNLMDLFLLQNGGSKQIPNNTETTATTNTSQSSPPVQRPSLFNDTLSTEKTDTDESTINKTASSTNSTSPSSSSSTTTTTDNISTTTVTTANTTPLITTTTTTNSTCPLPLPPSTITNQAMNLPSPFGRLPPPNLTRPPSSTLLPPPPPPGLFPMNSLGTGRVPILFSNNNGLPLPPPPNQILDINLIAQAAALAAVAKKFTTSTHHHPQSPSPQLGRDIDERDRQSSTTMRGDIDERPSDVYNNRSTTPNLNLLQTSMNVNSSSTPPPPPLQTTTTTTMNDDHLKPKTIQDIFRTQQKPTTVETLTNPSTAGPSFDFISMLEQLKQPKQTQSSNDNAYDSLEIRSSSTQSSPYILRTVIVSFKPYQLPNDPSDPRINKYQEKMSLWSEQERLERFKTTVPSFNNYSLPLRTQPQQTQSTIINDTNSSRDPRLLRNTVSSSKIGVPTMFPTSTTPFVRPNDNIL